MNKLSNHQKQAAPQKSGLFFTLNPTTTHFGVVGL